jgi:hypothetical protein
MSWARSAYEQQRYVIRSAIWIVSISAASDSLAPLRINFDRKKKSYHSLTVFLQSSDSVPN